MYHKKAFKNHCSHAAITTLRGKGLSKVDLKAKVADVFGVDVEDAEIAIRRVVSLVCLNEYFTYVFGKTLMDAKPKELEEIRADQVRYEGWRCGSKKVSFRALVDSIDFVSNNLK
jgi:hypothetical protein